MPTMDQLTEPMRRETSPLKFMGKLKDLADASHDVVMPLASLRLSETATTVRIARTDGEPMLLSTGVTPHVDATLLRTAHRHLAEKLGIPLKYLDDLVARHPDLAATNVNTLAERDGAAKQALFRLWNAEDGFALRAVLSDRYSAADNYPVMQAFVQGLMAADVDLRQCETEVDITPDRFRMRVAIPQIELYVPELLDGYRSPFSMDPNDPIHLPSRNPGGDALPVLWAGVTLANSETGGGAYTLTPGAIVLACRNGLTRRIDMIRQVHVGGKLTEGTIDWSNETRRLNAELLANMTKDAVTQFCSVEYLERIANEMREAKGLTVQQPAVAVEKVVERFQLTEQEHNDLLTAFMRSGDTSVLGIGQAVTAIAQLAEDSDRQADIEDAFWAIVNNPREFVGAAV